MRLHVLAALALTAVTAPAAWADGLSVGNLDTTLEPNEIITGINLPPNGFARHSTYLKLRDRTSFAFALVSVAAALEFDGDTIKDARLALGGVAHKPWRDLDAEQMLVGKRATTPSFEQVGEFVMRDAVGRRQLLQ